MCNHEKAVEIARGMVVLYKCTNCNSKIIKCTCGGDVRNAPPTWVNMTCIECKKAIIICTEGM